MAKRTVASCWKQFEKLSDTYLEQPEERAETLTKLQVLAEKANKDRIGDNTLAPLFVRQYINDPLSVVFVVEPGTEEQDGIPDWQSRLLEDEKRLEINPLGIVAAIRGMQKIEKDEIDDSDFLHQRYQSFLVELAKVPTIYLLFMFVLQRVAYKLQIAHLEKRGGVIEVAEGESYHTLLWAFKEFEAFARRHYSVNLRSDFGLYWYESDWITGR